MNDSRFHEILQAAVAGEHWALEKIFELYEPMISKYSYIEGAFDEDLHQYILIRIALKISKFNM